MELRDLGSERYLSITTFKRDGTPVSTPVWVVAEGDGLLVWTGAKTWKAKRIRRDAHVQVAACSARGAVRGPSLDATATVLEETANVERLLLAKYPVGYRLLRFANTAVRLVRRRPPGRSVTIALAPAAG